MKSTIHENQKKYKSLLIRNRFPFKKALLICSSVFLLASCEDLLKTQPITDEIYPGQETQILKDVTDAENAMKSCYATFGNEYWQLDYFFNGDAQTDVAYAGADNPQNFQIDEYRTLSTNTNVKRDWNYLTDFVKRCNLIINYADGVPELPQSRKDEMIGEASLIRALSNFQAVQLWGDFPIVTAYVTSINNANFDVVYPQLYPSRKPASEVYQAIITDCEVALAKAPSASNKYKANKGAANALLAKVYATKPNPDWEKVKQYSDAVITGGYTLLPVYGQLFDNAHEGNNESIWEVNGEGYGSTIGAWCTSMFQGIDWKKFNTPSNDLNKTFTDNADSQRKAASIKRQNVSWSDNYWSSFQFPFANKMRKTDGTQNFYLFRLGDIILLKAEALAHTGDYAGAMALVNQIRARVNITPVAAATTLDDAMDKIVKERYLELAFEGHRWFDLKRTGKAVAILSQQKDGAGVVLPYAASINENKLLWPVPQSIRDNNPNLSQNPGY